MVVAVFGVGGCAGGERGDALVIEAALAGRSVAESSPGNPIELHHEEITELTLAITNSSPQPHTVAHVRIEGEMLDLIFLTYDTGIHETLQPGEQRIVRFPIDFFDLEGQAHGLLRTRIRLFDADRVPLGSEDLVVDGRGSPFSTMSVFTLVLFAFAFAGFGWNLYRLAMRQLPPNAMARGLRFVHSGAAFGLAISAAFSTLRIWPLPTLTWLVITIVSALASFTIGYFSPGDDLEPQLPVINLTDNRGDPIRIASQSDYG